MPPNLKKNIFAHAMYKTFAPMRRIYLQLKLYTFVGIVVRIVLSWEMAARFFVRLL
jgi:hypothetical protein